jgi:O-6-methylguanine DNA methyltransferase
MRCRSALTRIDALRTGELKAAERGALKEHLRTCASCDESFTDLSHLAQAVKRLAPAPRARSWGIRPLADGFDRLEADGKGLWIAFAGRAIRMIHLGGTEEEFRARYARRFGRALVRESLPRSLQEPVLAVLAGHRARRVPVSLDEATPLETKVLETLARIPRGEVRTYAWVARQIGRPKAVRAVASVVARNVAPFVIPCHRVVPSAGGTGEYAFGPTMKRELLQREGVDVAKLDELARRGVRLIGSRTTRIACVPTCHAARRIRAENRVPFHGEKEAVDKGFRPCRRCRPFAA